MTAAIASLYGALAAAIFLSLAANWLIRSWTRMKIGFYVTIAIGLLVFLGWLARAHHVHVPADASLAPFPFNVLVAVDPIDVAAGVALALALLITALRAQARWGGVGVLGYTVVGAVALALVGVEWFLMVIYILPSYFS